MYHYQKNIGDYRSATMHLSLLEHGVYNQLLDWYYLEEEPIPTDNRTLFRRLSARTEAEQQAVVDVLSEMFKLTDSGWVHSRVEREISQYKAKAQQAREAGKLGGRPPKKGVGSPENRDGFHDKPPAKPTANQEPITNNQYSVTTDVVTAGDAGKSAAEMTKDELWKVGKSLLREAGMPPAQCGSFVGKLVKDYGDAIVIDAVRVTVVARPADPAEYLKATCMKAMGQRAPVNRQEALEQRNRAVADEWAAEMEAKERSHAAV